MSRDCRSKQISVPSLRILMLAGLLTGAGILAAGSAPVHPAQSQASDQDAAPQQPLELHEHMEAINDQLRIIFRSVTDTSRRDETLEAVTKLQKHLVAAKTFDPPALEERPGVERDAYAMDFRKRLAQVLSEVAQLEVEVIEARTEDALTRIREKIVAMRNEAHEIYQVDD